MHITKYNLRANLPTKKKNTEYSVAVIKCARMQRIDHCSPAKKLLAGDAMLQFFVKNYVI
jgi:hypothetical protein